MNKNNRSMQPDLLQEKLEENNSLHNDLMAAVDLYPDEEKEYVTHEFFEGIIENEEDGDELLELGVLHPRDEEKSENGYVWEDFEKTVEIVYDTPFSVPEVETKPYGKIPKLMLVSILFISPGIRYPPIRDTIGSVLDTVIGVLVAETSFLIAFSLVAIVTSVYSGFVQHRVKDKDKIQEIRDQIDVIQTEQYRMRQNGDEQDAIDFRNKYIFDENLYIKMPRELFRAFPWIMIVTLPFFIWILWSINVVGVSGNIPFPIIQSVPWDHQYLHLFPAWILWYVVVSMISRFGFNMIVDRMTE